MGCPVFLPTKDSKSREQLPWKASLLGKPACDSAWRAPLAGWKCELIRWISGLRGLSVCFAAAARVPWESQIWKRANFDKSRAETLSSLQYSFIPLPACKSSALVFGWKGIFCLCRNYLFSALLGKQWRSSLLYSGKRKSQTKQSWSGWRSLLVRLERNSVCFCGFSPLWRTTTL